MLTHSILEKNIYNFLNYYIYKQMNSFLLIENGICIDFSIIKGNIIKYLCENYYKDHFEG